MDSLMKIKEAAWAERVLASVERSHLSFAPYPANGLLYERDYSFLMPTSEMDSSYDYCLCFAQGRYDNFAAVVVRHRNGVREVAWPRDEHYFSRLCLLAVEHGRGRVYRDCQRLYAMATDTLSADVLSELRRIAGEYGDDCALMYDVMAHIYYGMVAEEHYQRVYDGVPEPRRTQVGKLMKMHALHRMLVDLDGVEAAASECVGMDPSLIAEQAGDMGIGRHVSWAPYSTMYDDPSRLPVVRVGDKKGV